MKSPSSSGHETPGKVTHTCLRSKWNVSRSLLGMRKFPKKIFSTLPYLPPLFHAHLDKTNVRTKKGPNSLFAWGHLG